MFSVIINIYNKKPKGPSLMELFTTTGKLKKFFFDNYRCSMCAPRVTHRTSIVVQKNFFHFFCGCEHFHEGRSFGFLVINVYNHGEHYETPCIYRTTLLKFILCIIYHLYLAVILISKHIKFSFKIETN